MEPSSPYLASFGLGAMLGLLVLLRLARRFAAPKEGGAALRLLQVGQVLSVFLVATYTAKTCPDGVSLARDIGRVAGFSVVGLALVLLTGRLGIRLLHARLLPEVERGNVAAGVAAGAHYAATGIITSRAAVGGSLRDLGLSLTFFVLAQITFYAFITLFRALTTYDDAEQIEGENTAAALSYAGAAIGVAIIIARAVEGDFEGWAVSLRGYGQVLLCLLALYPVRQILVQVLLLGAPFALRGGRLDLAIGAERDQGLGALEAVTYVATAIAMTRFL
jgi:uncharacterized membrane protein YjfL (UPF0719 family)